MDKNILYGIVIGTLRKELGEAAADLRVCVSHWPTIDDWRIGIYRETQPHDLHWDFRDMGSEVVLGVFMRAGVPWLKKKMGLEAKS